MSHPPEPLAIVGIGCRFPGAPNPTDYWKLLRGGIDAIRPIPSDRWNAQQYYDANPAKPGKMISRQGGFIDGIDGFDWRAFRISPREARGADPQHRLLLEVAWEAIDDAGIPFARIRARRASVFVGIMINDYQKIATRNPDLIDAYMMTGNFAFAANRISHTFGLEGPSVALDASCASSLMAVSLACDSVWSGAADMALAGGVNLILLPEASIAMTKANVLSVDERCRTFDASAGGFVRGEGAGVIVLKRLSDARRDHDRIYALVRGTFSNHNGTNEWIMAPSTSAQIKLLRGCYERAGIAPADVDYVEMHGTGTQKGDPIEARALAAVVGQGRSSARPCLVGSVKSNIGHLESASGIAALIKTALAIHHAQIPPSLHFHTLNPEIRDALGIELVTTPRPWPNEGRRIAGVTGLSFGGTNAHVVLSAPDPCDSEPSSVEPVEPERVEPGVLLLSARTASSLGLQAAAYRQFLQAAAEAGRPRARDILFSAAERRTHHEFRLAVVGSTAKELAQKLADYEASDLAVRPEPAGHNPPKIAFVFGGQGGQWLGMGRDLLARDRVFEEVFSSCDRVFRPRASWSMLDELRAEPGASRLADTEVAQPVLFAIQTALARAWMAIGVQPFVLIGHSMGEIAAAHVAGCLSLDEAVRVSHIRGRVMEHATGLGKMLQVALGKDDVLESLRRFPGELSLAADNSPSTVVLSGATAAIEELERELSGRGVDTRVVSERYPWHCRRLEPIAEELVHALDAVEVRSPSLPILPTAEIGRGVPFDAAYWGRHSLSTVCFREAVATALSDGVSVFVEIGPHPVLATAIRECAAAASRPVQILPSMRRRQNDREVFLQSVAELAMIGVSVDWAALDRRPGRLISLPTYAWQRDRCWVTHATGGQPESASHAHPTPLLAELVLEGSETADLTSERARMESSAEVFTRARIDALPPEEQPAALLRTVSSEVARVLRIQTTAPHQSLVDLGFDSMMAVELRSRLASALGVSLPLPHLLGDASASSIAARIMTIVEAGRERAKPQTE